jgi:hypothetical protein
MSAHRVTRQAALEALHRAAAAAETRVGELTTGDYRAFRHARLTDERLPSDLTISLLFGSWRRACQEAGRAIRYGESEGEVRRRLYGAP